MRRVTSLQHVEQGGCRRTASRAGRRWRKARKQTPNQSSSVCRHCQTQYERRTGASSRKTPAVVKPTSLPYGDKRTGGRNTPIRPRRSSAPKTSWSAKQMLNSRRGMAQHFPVVGSQRYTGVAHSHASVAAKSVFLLSRHAKTAGVFAPVVRSRLDG